MVVIFLDGLNSELSLLVIFYKTVQSWVKMKLRAKGSWPLHT